MESKKEENIEESECCYVFQFGVNSIPHPKKIKTGGEDASFVSPKILAVADGVSSWSRFNIDSGAYARALMEGLQRSAAAGTTHPLALVKDAYYFANQVSQ